MPLLSDWLSVYIHTCTIYAVLYTSVVKIYHAIFIEITESLKVLPSLYF